MFEISGLSKALSRNEATKARDINFHIYILAHEI